MDSVWKTVLASVGGAGAIIAGIVALCGNIIAKRLEKRYSHKLDTELEAIKSNLEQKRYISKIRFDKEFEVYIELSDRMAACVEECGIAVAVKRGMYGHEPEKIEQFYEEFTEKHNNFSCYLRRVAPFLNESMYTKYKSISDVSLNLLGLFGKWKLMNDGRWSQISVNQKPFALDEVKVKLEETQKLISKDFDMLNVETRTYLNSLDVR